jgi:transcriptional regulator with XRE-family HTH domain
MLTPDIDQFYKEMGRAIKSARLKRGLTQDIIARHLTLTRTSIINLEKGRHRPSIYQLLQIAEVLDLNYQDLIPFNDSTPNEKIPIATQKEIINNLDNAVIDPKMNNKSSRKAVFKFLTSIKK